MTSFLGSDFSTTTRGWHFYLGRDRYSGDGRLRWDPGEGVELVGRVSASPDVKSVKLHRHSIRDPVAVRGVRRDGVGFLFPWHTNTGDMFNCDFIEAKARRIILLRPASTTYWAKATGRCRVLCGGRITPDKWIEHETTLSGRVIGSGSSLAGFEVRMPHGFHGVGQKGNTNHLEFDYSTEDVWMMPFLWKLGETLPLALTLLTGTGARMIERFSETPHGSRAEARVVERPGYTGIHVLRDAHILKSDHLFGLAIMLAQDTLEALSFRTLAREMMVRRTKRDRQLFLGTAVEAVLRTIALGPHQSDQVKFKKLSKSFKAEHEIGRVAPTVGLTPSEVSLVKQSWRRQRHRNAHPHWLDHEDGEGRAEFEANWVDEWRLASFLGHVLAANCDGLEPAPLPRSIDDIRPA